MRCPEGGELRNKAELKDKLVNAILERATNMEEFCTEMKREFKKNLCPIRENRSDKRLKKSRRKYGTTLRRCL